MSRRSRKDSRRTTEVRSGAPKPGPGVVFVREFVSARTGREQRFRNIGEHPLTLAHARGRISDEQHAAGDEFRALCELRLTAGRDSTEMTPGSGGAGAGLAVTERQIDAVRRLAWLRARIKTRDWIILEKFCGEGWSMVEAVRAATLCHPSGVLYRVQEALDELVVLRGGRAGRSAQA